MRKSKMKLLMAGDKGNLKEIQKKKITVKQGGKGKGPRYIFGGKIGGGRGNYSISVFE